MSFVGLFLAAVLTFLGSFLRLSRPIPHSSFGFANSLSSYQLRVPRILSSLGSLNHVRSVYHPTTLFGPICCKSPNLAVEGGQDGAWEEPGPTVPGWNVGWVQSA